MTGGDTQRTTERLGPCWSLEVSARYALAIQTLVMLTRKVRVHNPQNQRAQGLRLTSTLPLFLSLFVPSAS